MGWLCLMLKNSDMLGKGRACASRQAQFENRCVVGEEGLFLFSFRSAVIYGRFDDFRKKMRAGN